MSENLAPELANEQEVVVLTEPEVETAVPEAEDSTLVEGEPDTTKEQTAILPATKDEIVAELKLISTQSELPQRHAVDALKQAFYRLRIPEINQEREQYVEAGGNAEEFVPTQDPLEDELKQCLQTLKEKRAQSAAEEVKQKEENLASKLQIIERIKELSESTDNFDDLFKEFKSLQKQWNEIKLIPANQASTLWRQYQIYSEKFYDLVKINAELRDYDFKKNFETKSQICEAVEQLNEEKDIVAAFFRLQNYHQQWREVGPVARDVREELWERFKKASTGINKRYQEHYETVKELEEANLQKKTEICNTLKEIDYEKLKTYNQWDNKARQIQELQAQWKTIGIVPRKFNTKIFEEFRALCDDFFQRRKVFYTEKRNELETNLDRKRTLLGKAIALKDSEDWDKTARQIAELQKEWKTVGAVPHKFSNQIWKDFQEACDYFFERRKAVGASQKEEEHNNLELKKEVVERIKAIDYTTDPQIAKTELFECIDQWRSIGFVPFRQKEKLTREYQEALDAGFEKLKIDKTERRLQSYRSSLETITKGDHSNSALYKEREKLVYQFNKLKSELQTYENNIGFLTLSKGSSPLLKDMNKKMDDLRNEIDLLARKIKATEDSINESAKAK